MPNALKECREKGCPKYLECRNGQRRRYYHQFNKNAINRMKQYTQHELDMIVDHSIPDRELSVILGRSVRAIQSTRARLKKREC